MTTQAPRPLCDDAATLARGDGPRIFSIRDRQQLAGLLAVANDLQADLQGRARVGLESKSRTGRTGSQAECYG
jgi:hypothetical protein